MRSHPSFPLLHSCFELCFLPSKRKKIVLLLLKLDKKRDNERRWKERRGKGLDIKIVITPEELPTHFLISFKFEHRDELCKTYELHQKWRWGGEKDGEGQRLKYSLNFVRKIRSDCERCLYGGTSLITVIKRERMF